MLKQNLLDEDDMKILQKVEQDIDNILHSMTVKITILSFEYFKNGGFVRMSTRSPKDASFGTARNKKKLAELLANIDKQNLSEQEVQNEEFISFFTAQIQSLHIYSG